LAVLVLFPWRLTKVLIILSVAKKGFSISFFYLIFLKSKYLLFIKQFFENMMALFSIFSNSLTFPGKEYPNNLSRAS
jgi:hypothetical protein